MLAGNSPVNALLLRYSFCSLGREAKKSGTFPPILLKDRNKTVRLPQLPRLPGSSPAIWLL
uniref:Uncharacterized protein n=1 Tax=Arundo donax TaxID=35708 RepID=A0A0A9AZV3_ARUDO